MTAAQNLAANVRRLAARSGLSLAHVADFAGLGRTTTFRLLSSEDPSDPRLSTVDALAALFRVQPADLLSSPDAPLVAPRIAPLARNRMEEPVTPDAALAELRALLGHARATDADVLSIPLDLADAVTRCADVRAADLLAVLGALDLADCSPRMILRRAALIGRLRLDGDDAEARSQAADLCDAAKLRRHLRDALADTVERGDNPRAQKLRAILIAADDESLGWQGDALAALGAKDERG